VIGRIIQQEVLISKWDRGKLSNNKSPRCRPVYEWLSQALSKKNNHSSAAFMCLFFFLNFIIDAEIGDIFISLN
jgi:hypothetical protein